MNDITVFGRVRGADRGISEIAAVSDGLVVVAIGDGLAGVIKDGLSGAVMDGLAVAVKDGLAVAIRDGLAVAIRDGLAVVVRDGLESACGSGSDFVIEMVLVRGKAAFVEWE